MIRINLLPFRDRRIKENIRRQVSIFFLSLTLVLLVMGVVFFYLSNQVGDYERKIKRAKEELKKYEAINKEIAEMKKQLSVLEQKIDVIDRLELNRHAPVHMMETMTQAIVPKSMWLTRFESRDKTVKLLGIAKDNESISKYMINLENAKMIIKEKKRPVFSHVKLLAAKHIVVAGKNLKSFQILCTKTPLQKPKQDASKAKKKPKKRKK